MPLNIYSVIAIALAALCTFATRAVPFALFGGKKEVPPVVNYLGKVLPAAIIATLINQRIFEPRIRGINSFLP